MTNPGDSGAVGSVILASAQSVGKVYVIGLVGFLATRFPRRKPLLPHSAVKVVANFGFHVLVIPLVYSTTAMSISPSSIRDFWFVVAGAFVVIAISYATATFLGCCLLRDKDKKHYGALMVAATFPNIVALPILIFPSLCEYSVVYEGFFDGDESTTRECEARSSTMIFCYFFSWSLAFYSFGEPRLTGETVQSDQHESQSLEIGSDDIDEPERTTQTEPALSSISFLGNIHRAVIHTVTSAGFLAIIAGFVTGCIPPLQRAMFENEGALRFLGGALETLGRASSPMSTMVVAASLAGAPPAFEDKKDEAQRDQEISPESPSEHLETRQGPQTIPAYSVTESTLVIDAPRVRRRPSGFESLRKSFRQHSVNLFKLERPQNLEQTRLLVWFILSRLVVTPCLVVALILSLECSSSSLLDNVPGIAKLILIVNSSLPSALVVVVLLKSNDAMMDAAAAVARVYLPSYLLSIFSIAGWTALGLYITLPGDDGKNICGK